MGVVTFVDYTPTPRFDGNAWSEVDVEESDSATLSDATVWSVIETFALSPLDSDPENPVARSFTTELASDTINLWYRLIFRDVSGDEEQPTTPVQNVVFSAYASVLELARILKIRAPTDEQEAGMRRVLTAAAGEINSEIDLAADEYLEGWQLALAAQVNLERAVEHWRQQEAPFGLLAIEGALGPAERTARDSFARHASKLAPLKSQQGFA